MHLPLNFLIHFGCRSFNWLQTFAHNSLSFSLSLRSFVVDSSRPFYNCLQMLLAFSFTNAIHEVSIQATETVAVRCLRSAMLLRVSCHINIFFATLCSVLSLNITRHADQSSSFFHLTVPAPNDSMKRKNTKGTKKKQTFKHLLTHSKWIMAISLSKNCGNITSKGRLVRTITSLFYAHYSMTLRLDSLHS